MLKIIHLFPVFVFMASCHLDKPTSQSKDQKLQTTNDSIYSANFEIRETLDSAKFLYYALNRKRYLVRDHKAKPIVTTQVVIKSFQFENSLYDNNSQTITFDILGYENGNEIFGAILEPEPIRDDKYNNEIYGVVVNSCFNITAIITDRHVLYIKHDSIRDPNTTYVTHPNDYVKNVNFDQHSLNPWFREQLIQRGIL